MKKQRFIACFGVLTLLLMTQDCVAQNYQLQDAVGLIEFADPGVTDEPNAPQGRWVVPLIMKQFRFEGSPGAVLVSTWLRPGVPADDTVLEKVQARNQQQIQIAGAEHFIVRRFDAAAGGVLEVISLNARYDDSFPFNTSINPDAKALEAVGISQTLVREGRLIELAMHLPIQEGEDQDTLITRARSICDAWRVSFKAHPIEPWEPALSDAPEGYTWWLCPQTKTALRKPDGWHTKVTVVDGLFGYFISKEDIDELGEFTTGLTVNVTPQADQRYKTEVGELVGLTIGRAADAGEVLEDPWPTVSEPLVAYSIVVKHKDAGKGDFVTYRMAIGNVETGTLYIIIFEAPANEWEQAWKLGKPIIEQLILSPDI